MLALAGAALLASGLAQLHAQDMGQSSGPVDELTQSDAESLQKYPDLVFVLVFRENASPEQYTREGNQDTGTYMPPTTAVTFSGDCNGEDECKQAHGGKDYVETSGSVSTKALAALLEGPITEVIPGVIIKGGNESCWWSCSKGSCDCVCAPAKNPPACRTQ